MLYAKYTVHGFNVDTDLDPQGDTGIISGSRELSYLSSPSLKARLTSCVQCQAIINVHSYSLACSLA